MIKVTHYIKIECEYENLIDYEKTNTCISLDFKKGAVEVYPIGSKNLKKAYTTRKPKIEKCNTKN